MRVYFSSNFDDVAKSSVAWCAFRNAHLPIFEALPSRPFGASHALVFCSMLSCQSCWHLCLYCFGVVYISCGLLFSLFRACNS
jgi:hypothetical protein